MLRRPTASPISRIDGGYPCCRTASRTNWSTSSWRSLSACAEPAGSRSAGIRAVAAALLPLLAIRCPFADRYLCRMLSAGAVIHQ